MKALMMPEIVENTNINGIPIMIVASMIVSIAIPRSPELRRLSSNVTMFSRVFMCFVSSMGAPFDQHSTLLPI
jgi:hypothetical protein